MVSVKRWAGWGVLLAALIYAGFIIGRAVQPARPQVAAVKTVKEAKTSAGPSQYGLSPGQFAPNFTLETTTGKVVTLADLRGHPVWLNFWATWCPWCKKEIPQIETVQKDDGSTIDIYGVDIQQSAATVSQYMTAKQMNYPVLLDTQGSVAAAYGVEFLPTSVFIAPSGKILAVSTGALISPKDVAPYVQKLLHSV